jgi:hypothetical protein
VSIQEVYPEWRREYHILQRYDPIRGFSDSNVLWRLKWIECLSRVAASAAGSPARGRFYKHSGRIFIELEGMQKLEIDEPNFFARQIRLELTDILIFLYPRTGEPVVVETEQGFIKLQAPGTNAFAVAGRDLDLPPAKEFRRTLSAASGYKRFKEFSEDCSPGKPLSPIFFKHLASSTALALGFGLGVPILIFACFFIFLPVSLSSRPESVQMAEIQKTHHWSPLKIARFGNAIVSMSGKWSSGVLHYRFSLEDRDKVFKSAAAQCPEGFFQITWPQWDGSTVARIQIPFSQMKPAMIDNKSFFVAEGTYPCSCKQCALIWDINDWIVSWSNG